MTTIRLQDFDVSPSNEPERGLSQSAGEGKSSDDHSTDHGFGERDWHWVETTRGPGNISVHGHKA